MNCICKKKSKAPQYHLLTCPLSNRHKIKEKDFLVKVVVKTIFSSTKDVRATSKEDAIQKAKNLVLEVFDREVNPQYWHQESEIEFVEVEIE